MPLDDRRNKKMLVFSAPSNPIWRKFLGNTEVSQQAILRLMGISPTALSNWKRSSPIGNTTFRRIFERLNTQIQTLDITPEEKYSLTEILGEFQQRYSDNSHLFTAAKVLPMSPAQCRVVMDTLLYEQRSIFYEMHYDATDRNAVRRAENYLNTYGGGYYAWVLRGDVWFRCPLHVRYMIRVGDGLLIRCKLNIPKIVQNRGDIHYYKYDGFMVRRPHRVFWMFEKRDSDLNDYFYFITGIGRRSGKILTMGGTYLTTDQDQEQSIASGDIFLRALEMEDAEAIDKMMREDAAVLEDDKISKLNNDLKKQYGIAF